MEDVTRLLNESRMLERPLKPEVRLPMEWGNDDLLAVPWGQLGNGVYVNKHMKF